MDLLLADVIKLLSAILVGGLVGAEREFRDKAAGFRTIIFICVGACLFTIFSLKLGAGEDPVRIASSIVSGVGFLGAGAIMRGSRRVMGLTTAATIWLAAALGMGLGGGYFAVVGAATIAVLIVLWFFPRIEILIDNVRDARLYEVTCPLGEEEFTEVEGLFLKGNLKVRRKGRTKSGADMVCKWEVQGKPHEHDQLVDRLLAHPDVREFQV